MTRNASLKTLVSAAAAAVLLTVGKAGVSASVLELPTDRGEGLELLMLLTVRSEERRVG